MINAEKFWSKVDKTDVCWNWTASTNGNGYGQFKVSRTRKNITAHRMSYVLHHGQIPDGLWVLHKCDNRKCVNPDHLFLGDAAANVHDMDAKGRRVVADFKGSKNGRAVLNEEAIAKIRLLYGTVKRAELCKLFGVGKSQIHRIATGQQWASVKALTT
jgi:hypothetical protein